MKVQSFIANSKMHCIHNNTLTHRTVNYELYGSI